jgi:hypothetical protein
MSSQPKYKMKLTLFQLRSSNSVIEQLHRGVSGADVPCSSSGADVPCSSSTMYLFWWEWPFLSFICFMLYYMYLQSLVQDKWNNHIFAYYPWLLLSSFAHSYWSINIYWQRHSVKQIVFFRRAVKSFCRFFIRREKEKDIKLQDYRGTARKKQLKKRGKPQEKREKLLKLDIWSGDPLELIKFVFAEEGHLTWLKADVLEDPSISLLPNILPEVDKQPIKFSFVGFIYLCATSSPIIVKRSTCPNCIYNQKTKPGPRMS